MADRRDLELARALGVSSDLRRSQLLAAVRDLVAFRIRVQGEAPAAEIAARRVFERWMESDRSTASAQHAVRDAFRAGSRHMDAVWRARVAEPAWIGADEVPVDQR
jgi:hypothetical protein